MKVQQSDAERLLIVDCPLWVGLICFPASLVLLYHFIASLVRGASRNREAFVSAVAFLLSFFCGAAFIKRSVFDFDLVRRQLTWTRRGLFGRKGGAVPFNQIQFAVVESEGDSHNSLSYRVALSTAGGTIPLTESYDSGNDKQCDAIRTAINQALHSDLASEIENDILHMAETGRKVAAVKLAAKRYGYDLAQAQQFVEGLMK